MTKKMNRKRYAGISSFDDLKSEQENLAFRLKITETKLKLDAGSLVNSFSIVKTIKSATGELALKWISRLFETISGRSSDKNSQNPE